MRQDQADFQLGEFTEDYLLSEGVTFDPQETSLQGSYVDELSAYRARKGWAEALEAHFLLDAEQDFQTEVKSDLDRNVFTLNCYFHSACARYAFWRLTNNQAPEAQYLIETAHIPQCEAHLDDFIRAPDMMSKLEANSALLGRLNSSTSAMEECSSLINRIKNLVKKLNDSIR